MKLTKYVVNFEFTQVCDFGRNVIETGLCRQTKHRNIAVMAMEAEKVMEESSKRLEMSVSISQDALEVEDDDVALEEADVSDCRSPSPDLDSSSPNLYCRQIPLQYFPTSNLADFLQTLIKRSPGWLPSLNLPYQTKLKMSPPLISPKLSKRGLNLKKAPYQPNFCNYPKDLKLFANISSAKTLIHVVLLKTF